MSINLVVDIGNSHAKCAVIKGEEILFEGRANSFDELDICDITKRYSPLNSIVCSTRGDGAEAQQRLEEIIGHSLHFRAGVATPLKINYSTPSTLGADRVAAAVEIAHLCKGTPALIIDCGTAITIDLINEEGEFCGGFISAGLSLRYQALNNYTASLPLCTPPLQLFDGEAPASTKEAIEQGVLASVTYEIEGHIAHFREKYENLSIFFIGGEAFHFEKRIKNTIFAGREVIFRALNKILEHNATK